MKPLIFISIHKHKKVREEFHLHSSIENALKKVNVETASSVFDDYDLVHFLAPDDLRKIMDAKRAGVKIVMSALMCENEKKTAMLVLKGNRKYELKNKFRKMLNLADLVLVPGMRAKTFLEQQGVLNHIEIFPAPIDIECIESNAERNKKLFLNYFGINKNLSYILCVGDYNNKNEMANLMEIAELSPFVKFYFFGANYNAFLNSKYIKKNIDNVVFSNLVDEDIYLSALSNAKALLVLTPYGIEAMNVLEAMASKTQVIAVSKHQQESFLKHKVNAYLHSGVTELVDSIHKLVNNKLKLTTENAYKFASKYDLAKSGKRLKELYELVLKGE